MTTPLLELIGQIHIFEKNRHKALSDPRKAKILTVYFYVTVLMPVLAVVAAIIAYVAEVYEAKLVALIFLILGYLAIYFLPIFSACLYSNTLRDFFRNSLRPHLINSSIAIKSSNHFLPKLMAFSYEEIQLVAIELKTERDAFERRIGLISGAIDKIGLGPGLLAAVAAIIKLKTDLQGVGATDWLIGAAYAVLGLYIMAVAGHMSILKMDRALKLLDLALIKIKNRD